MFLCEKHLAALYAELKSWGLGYMVLKNDHARQRRALLAAERGLVDLSTVDPMRVALLTLQSLLEGQFVYDENDDDLDPECTVCFYDVEPWLKLVANAAATRVRLLRGPYN